MVERAPVVVDHWSAADAVVVLIGVALALIGLIALSRTEVDSSWFQPVEKVLGANHTALLGAAELGAGVLLMVAVVTRSRALAALVGLAMLVGGIFGGIETSEVNRELAIEEWWAWLLAGTGALVALLAFFYPRRRTVDRLVEPL